MKKFLEALGLILILISTTGMKPANLVVLTAADVSSAVDIEQAIMTATAFGAHPGTVILDARKGDFYYSGDDKSINIFYPNLTIRSNNGAVLANCADGFFFDDLPADNIHIEGITFRCTGNGIAATGGVHNHRNVTVWGNIFDVEGEGIGLGFVSDWSITRNRIEAGSYPVSLIATQRIRVTHNYLAGHTAIRIGDSYNPQGDRNMITQNVIKAEWVGIALNAGADANHVIQNKITGVQLAGINFEWDNHHNKVIGNRVACASGYGCEIVIASPEAYANNTIRNNKFMK